MKKIITIIIIIIALLGCTSEKAEIKLRLLSDNEFMLEGTHYPMNQFREVFVSAVNKKVKEGHQKKYDVVLKVHNGVSLKTIQQVKVGFVKVKNEINQIIYSHESER